VDIAAQDEAVSRIRRLVKNTLGPEVVSSVGGFAALYRLPDGSLLAASTDGVGSKLLLSSRFGRHRDAGRDLVAAVMNDVVATDARPMLLLDYIGIHRVVPEVIEELVAGMAEECSRIGAALVGGEIAELGDLYPPGTYELVGFGLGRLEGDPLPRPELMEPGDVVVGFASSGVHCNGYTLVRRVFEGLGDEEWTRPWEELGEALVDALLRPTLCYAPLVARLREEGVGLKALVHVSGGGIEDNLARVLPAGLDAEVDTCSIPTPKVFAIIAARGGVSPKEMWHTFNMGAGYLAVVATGDEGKAVEVATQAGFEGFVCGRLVEGKGEVRLLGLER